MYSRMFLGAVLSICLAVSLDLGNVGTARADASVESARFRVGTDVVTPDLGPFTATIVQSGNGSRLTGANTGFEPLVFRTMFQADAEASDRILAPRHVISQYDTLRTGALDGAEVDVFRVEDGKMRLVRSDRIAEGGHQASGWNLLTGKEAVAPGVSRFYVALPGWWRPSARQYLSIRAIDSFGRLSDHSDAAEITTPTKPGAETPANETVQRDPATPEAPSLVLSPPQNVSARVTRDGVIELTWDRVQGRTAGYLVYISDQPPESHRGYYLALEGDGPPIMAGDLVMLRHKFYRGSRMRMHTNRVWGAAGETRVSRMPLVKGFSDERDGGLWELRAHPEDTPVPEAGETYLSLEYRNDDGATLGLHNHSGTGQSWYPVLDPGATYRFEVWMRGKALRPAVLRFWGPYRSGTPGGIGPFQLPVTEEWTQHVVEFRVPSVDDGRLPGAMFLHFEGAGQVDVDNLRIYRTDTPYMQWLPEDVERLTASGMSTLRTHAFIKSGQSTYDLEQLTNPRGAINGTASSNTLHETLERIAAVGMTPWIQVEPHFTRDEWLGLVEYLAAPFDPEKDSAAEKPWAAKRASLGQVSPWTEDFDTIQFEIGNETWNNLFRPWVFPGMPDAGRGKNVDRGAVYGLYQEYVLSIMRDSPYWPLLEDRLQTVVGGWNGFDYGRNAAAASPSSDVLAIAAYVGGWDENEGPVSLSPASYFSVLNQVSQTALPRALQHAREAAEIGRARGRPLAVGTYEAGPGYALNGLNGAKVTEEQAAEQEQVMKSLAAGTATLDTFLARAAEGFIVQNYFIYGPGAYWKSHAEWQNGGQTYPSWDMLALFNNHLTGDLLEVQILQTPTVDLPSVSRREAVDDAPLIGVYATRKADRLSVVVMSRRVPDFPTAGDDGRTSVTVELPMSKAGSVTRFRMTGGYAAHNVDRRSVEVVSEPMPMPETPGLLEIPDLPPGETYIYVFDGVAG